jgi:ArsR family transcriptional regulator
MDAKTYYLELRAKVFKALGHPSRLKMIESLFEGERCVCELQEIVGSDISTVSKHLTILKEAGIIADDRRGVKIYYTLQMQCVAGFVGCLNDFLGKRLQEQIVAHEEVKASSGG